MNLGKCSECGIIYSAKLIGSKCNIDRNSINCDGVIMSYLLTETRFK